jgi:hypothetical protein
MRVWFMMLALALGTIGYLGVEGRSGRLSRLEGVKGGTVSAQDDPNPIPSPKPR